MRAEGVIVNFFRDLTHRPRRLFLRRVAFQIHLWLGILLSLYLVLISLSGALMVYHDTLTWSTLPAGLSPYDQAHTASLSTVIASAQSASPGAVITYLKMPSAGVPAFQLQMRNWANKLFMVIGDPQTGRISPLPRTWVDVIYDFHTHLLLGSAHGAQWNGAGAMGLLLLCCTGIILWWRGLRNWWHGLRVSLRQNWRRINYDLHHAIGLWTLFVVSWWAISGIYFAWYEPFSKTVNAISPLVGMREPRSLSTMHTKKPPTLQAILDGAQKASPQGKLSYLFNPGLTQDEDIYAYMNLRTQEDFGHVDIVWFDIKNGEIVSLWHYGQNHSAGDWFLWAMQPFHFGTFWGPWVRALWCLLGVSLAILTVTGVLMYWNRFLRLRWKDLAAQSSEREFAKGEAAELQAGTEFPLGPQNDNN